MINDETLLLQMTRVKLEAAGHEVRTRETGSEGLAICPEWSPGLILLDYNLRKDGPEVTAVDYIPEFKRVCGEDVPIIVVSATKKRLSPVELQVADVILIDLNNGFKWSILVPTVEKYLSLAAQQSRVS